MIQCMLDTDVTMWIDLSNTTKFVGCSLPVRYVVKTYPSIDPVVAPPILLNVIFVFTSVAMTLRSQRSIYGHCLGHGSGTCMLKAARDICYQL